MSDRKKLATVLAGVALIAALVGLSFVLHIGPWKTKDLGPVIARVDGAPIYLSQAAARVQGLSTVHGDIEKTLGNDWQEKVLQNLVDDQIIREEAERRGISISQREVAISVLRLQERFPSEEEFQQWLVSQHMDLDELERRVELQALTARVYTAIAADATVSKDEIREYYRSHRDQYRAPDGTTPSFAQVRDTIKQQLEKEEKDQVFGAWLDGRRQDVTVVVLLDDWWRNIA